MCIWTGKTPFRVNAQVISSSPDQYEESDSLRVGLVLSGGGAMGIAHIGIIRAIEEAGIRIDYITDTSMVSLVVEILSPSTAKYDLDEKKDVYECHGVKEYWIVDPATKSAQGFFLNDKGQYGEPGKRKGQLYSRLLNTQFDF